MAPFTVTPIFLLVLFCEKSTKSAGVAKRQWRLVSNDRNEVETLRFPPDPFKTPFFMEKLVFITTNVC